MALKMKLKWFEVAVSVEEGQRLWVQAENERQAGNLIDWLVDYGELPVPASHRDIVHRDVYVVEITEHKEGYIEPQSKRDAILAGVEGFLINQMGVSSGKTWAQDLVEHLEKGGVSWE
jgi:hypothetical protein